MHWYVAVPVAEQARLRVIGQDVVSVLGRRRLLGAGQLVHLDGLHFVAHDCASLQICEFRSTSLGQGLRMRKIRQSVRPVSRKSSRALKPAGGLYSNLVVSTPRRVSREYSTAVESKNTVVFLYLNKETCWQVREIHCSLGTRL